MGRWYFDGLLFLPIFFLLGASLIMLHSMNQDIFVSQCVFLVLSVIVFFVIQLFDVREIAARSWGIYAMALLFLFILSFLGIASRGAVRWFSIGNYSIQISEILKPFFALWLAQLLVHKEKNLKTLLTTCLLAFPIIFMVYREPDLGSALVYVFAMLILFVVMGFPFKYFAIGIGSLAVLSPILWHFLHDYQRERLVNFFSTNHDPLGSSYNSIQSMIAVGSGQWWGRGVGVGTQSMLRFLPERHTDFMFASYSEATGFIGATLVLVAVLLYLWRISSLARSASDQFVFYFLTLTFGFLFVQSVVNVGMNIGVLPIVGITLPFFSYGGSSLLTSTIFLGFATKLISSEEKSLVEIR